MHWNPVTNQWQMNPPKPGLGDPKPPRKKPAPKPPRKRWLPHLWGPEPYRKPYCVCAEAEEEEYDWFRHRWSRHDRKGVCLTEWCDCARYRPSKQRPPKFTLSTEEDGESEGTADRFDRYKEEIHMEYKETEAEMTYRTNPDPNKVFLGIYSYWHAGWGEEPGDRWPPCHCKHGVNEHSKAGGRRVGCKDEACRPRCFAYLPSTVPNTEDARGKWTWRHEHSQCDANPAFHRAKPQIQLPETAVCPECGVDYYERTHRWGCSLRDTLVRPW